MSLITLWHGEVELPPLPRRRVKIGENVVEQSPFPGAIVAAEIKTCSSATVSGSHCPSGIVPAGAKL